MFSFCLDRDREKGLYTNVKHGQETCFVLYFVPHISAIMQYVSEWIAKRSVRVVTLSKVITCLFRLLLTGLMDAFSTVFTLPVYSFIFLPTPF